MQKIRSLVKNTKAATAIEYGLIAALIAIALVAAMSTLQGSISNLFNGAADNLETATPSA